MKLVLASDHAGFHLKQQLVSRLKSEGHQVLDLGAFSTESVDYTDYAQALCQAVLDGKAERGILICNSGVGMSIAANRFKGIRAALCLFPEWHTTPDGTTTLMCLPWVGETPAFLQLPK